MNSVFPWGGSHIGISRILSCAAVNILPMVEMLRTDQAVLFTPRLQANKNLFF